MDFSSFAVITVMLVVCQTTVTRAGKTATLITCDVYCAFETLLGIFSSFKRLHLYAVNLDSRA